MLEIVDMTQSKIKILNKQTNEELYSFDISEHAEAYEKAKDLEEMGLDILISTPGVTQTLCDTLGIENDAREDYENSVAAEMHDHEGSCCVTYKSDDSDTLQ